MKTFNRLTRRDRCWLVGQRAGKLKAEQRVHAWDELVEQMAKLGEMDVPKFRQLLRAVRKATLAGRNASRS